MNIKLSYAIFCVILFCSCSKKWLEKKPDQSLVVPESIIDAQALLDNSALSNSNALMAIGSDDYFIESSRLSSLPTNNQSVYLWAEDGYGITPVTYWANPYSKIYYSNVCLKTLSNIDKVSANAVDWNNAHGGALFIRAFSYFELLQAFAKSYDKSTAQTDLGVPLRLEADIAQRIGRGTLSQVYDLVLNDLYTASQELPLTITYKTRATKVSAYALLARIYLSMEQYDLALKYADSVLNNYKLLNDYNSYTPNIASSFPSWESNKEIIYFSQASEFLLFQSVATVDTTFLKSYASNDLRRSLFFGITSGRDVWTGNYTGSRNAIFTGLSVDEMYLIRAECYARTNEVEKAMADLNSLLITRWKSTKFTPFLADNKDEALMIILSERRKQLAFRGLRWSDLRRFSKNPQFELTIERYLNGNTYKLLPNDKKYTWLIPDDEILYGGLEQNPR